MGKTIMLSALIHTLHGPDTMPQPKKQNAPQPTKQRQQRLDAAFRTTSSSSKYSEVGPLATLIVAPTSLLAQWAEELTRCSAPGSVNVLVWHGSGRLDLETTVEDDRGAAIVVITSYGTLASEHAKVEKMNMQASPLYRSASALSR